MPLQGTLNRGFLAEKQDKFSNFQEKYTNFGIIFCKHPQINFRLLI